MGSERRDSGTYGRYSTPPSAFSSEAYGRYVPSAADYSSKFHALLKRWRFETLTTSSPDEIVDNNSFREIVEMGEDVLPLIVVELRSKPDFLIVAMSLITGENPIRPHQLGDINKMTQAWLDWYDQHRS